MSNNIKNHSCASFQEDVLHIAMCCLPVFDLNIFGELNANKLLTHSNLVHETISHEPGIKHWLILWKNFFKN